MRPAVPLQLALLALLIGPARAQAPSVAAVWPPGGARGAEMEADLEGAALAGASPLIAGRGVTLTALPGGAAERLRVKVSIDRDAPVGPREVRAVTPRGLSNPVYLWVGHGPQRPETEPNDAPESATRLAALPVTVDSRFGGQADVDQFAFEASAGDVIVVDVCAARLGSAADVVVELRDASGRPLAIATEGFGRDPRIVHTIAVAGTYRVVARDALYRGGPAYVYRLAIGKLPLIASLDPQGGRRGEPLAARVAGFNLGGLSQVRLDLPADMPVDRPFWVSIDTPNGPSLPIPVCADDHPQIQGAAADRIVPIAALPVTASARFGGPREEHRYALSVPDAGPVRIRGLSRTIGASATLVLRVLGPGGNELATTEDQTGRDPALRFVPPGPGSYEIRVRSANTRAGADLGYRLAVERDDRPSFRMTASPDIAVLQRGQTVGVVVRVERTGGFEGAVTAVLERLPTGASARPTTIGPASATATLTITAGPDAPLSVEMVRIVGTGETGGGNSLRGAATPVGTYPRPGEGQPESREVGFQALSVVEGVPLYALIVEPSEVTVAPGGSVTLQVRAARKPNDNAAEGPIGLEVRDLPPGVSAEAAALPPKMQTAVIKLTAAPGATPGTQTVVVAGKLGENLQIAPSVTVHVRK